MENNFPDICRFISIFSRLMEMYYNRELLNSEIGWGQLYMEYIYDHPGVTPQELTDYFRVDKATLTKVIRKLLEIEYLTVRHDENDGRVRHLYLTEKADKTAKHIKQIHCEFYNLLHGNIPTADFELTENTIKKMIDNMDAKIKRKTESKNV